jgi:hypothetical protein
LVSLRVALCRRVVSSVVAAALCDAPAARSRAAAFAACRRRFQLSCGIPRGYWSGDTICGDDMTVGAPFYCSSPVSHGPSGSSTQWTYYGCTDGISSCYAANAPSTCCGCVDWWKQGLNVPPAPTTTACINVNDEWVSDMLPHLLWLKTACPSCYVFPYDDVSSTFQCGVIADDVNTVNYTITFCPKASE